MERPDPYGEWVLHQNSDPNDATAQAINEKLVTAARAVWPRVLAHARIELRGKASEPETEALAGEVWESVLKSVAKALQRKRDALSCGLTSIADETRPIKNLFALSSAPTMVPGYTYSFANALNLNWSKDGETSSDVTVPITLDLTSAKCDAPDVDIKWDSNLWHSDSEIE